MVTYLKNGQDFGSQHFSRDFGFTQSASRKGGSMPDTNQAEAVRVRSGTNFQARDPGAMNVNDRSYDAMENAEIAREPLRKGGRVKRAEGGSTWEPAGSTEDGMPRFVEKPAYNERQSRLNELKRRIDEDNNAPTRKAAGGRIKRAIGGVIPGQAPAPMAQPMTRPQSPPQAANPLARATVTMPASDMSQLAAGAVKLGAKQAISALAQHAQQMRGPMPGAAATAPAAVAPPPPPQGGVGVPMQGMRKGGHARKGRG